MGILIVGNIYGPRQNLKTDKLAALLILTGGMSDESFLAVIKSPDAHNPVATLSGLLTVDILIAGRIHGQGRQ